MLCDLCKTNEASVFMELFVDNQNRSLKFCPSCARKYGLTPEGKKPSARTIQELLEAVERQSKYGSESFKSLCPSCGKSLGDILEQGRAGCPECYFTFKNQIRKVLMDNGAGEVYEGSMPYRLKDFRSSLTDRQDLQRKLDEALRNENYEKACVYRDYIRALEKGSVQDASDSVADFDMDSQSDMNQEG